MVDDDYREEDDIDPGKKRTVHSPSCTGIMIYGLEEFWNGDKLPSSIYH